MATLQAEAPEQAPLHPESCQPSAGRTSSATTVPSANWAEQVDPQSMPAGVETTVPDPWTATRSVRICAPGGALWKVAPTVASAFIGTTQAEVPEHAPS